MLRSIARASLLSGVAAAVLMPFAAAQAEDAADASKTTEGDAIVVTGDKPTTVASAATKTDTPIIETPQSISVIDASEIKNLGLQNLNQALRYVAGVTPETRGADAEVYDQFTLRGFAAPVFLDGLKEFTSASGYAAAAGRRLAARPDRDPEGAFRGALRAVGAGGAGRRAEQAAARSQLSTARSPGPTATTISTGPTATSAAAPGRTCCGASMAAPMARTRSRPMARARGRPISGAVTLGYGHADQLHACSATTRTIRATATMASIRRSAR